jgi:hypothetical protein
MFKKKKKEDEKKTMADDLNVQEYVTILCLSFADSQVNPNPHGYGIKRAFFL